MEVATRFLWISPYGFQTCFACRSPLVSKNIDASEMDHRIRAGQINATRKLKLLSCFYELSQRLIGDSQLCVGRIEVGRDRDSLFEQPRCLDALLTSAFLCRRFIEVDCASWIAMEECRSIDHLTNASVI